LNQIQKARRLNFKTATSAGLALAGRVISKFHVKKPLPGVVIIFATIAPLTAGTIRVPAEKATIQEGIDTADPGDTVLVAAGTYSGENNRELDYDGKGIVLLSEEGAEVTKIHCGGETGGVIFENGETADAVLSGFTICNGNTAKGGGIIFENGSSPRVESCVIESCTVNIYGGGVSCTGSSPVFDNCTIRYNIAVDCSGAGISINEHSAPVFKYCSVYGNLITGT